MRTRRIRVTVFKIPVGLPADMIASYLSAYDLVEEVEQFRASAGTAHEDHVYRLCLNKEEFQAIPDTLFFKERQMMVVVEVRQPHCWKCKQVGHLAKACLQKKTQTNRETSRIYTNTGNQHCSSKIRPTNHHKRIDTCNPQEEGYTPEN